MSSYKVVAKTDVPLQITKPATGIDLDNFLWSEDKTIYKILTESKNIEEARIKLFQYLADIEWTAYNSRRDLHPLVESILYAAVKVFKNIISRKNEELTGYSSLKYLWLLAHNPTEGKKQVDEGFIYEFHHLFKAINGRPDIYPAPFAEDLEYFDFSQIRGQEAGIARSNYLDKLSKKIEAYLSRYPSGLDPQIIEARKKTAQKILEELGGTWDDWRDYQWHFRNVFKGRKGIELLAKLARLDEETLKALYIALEYKIPFGVTPYYLHLFDLETPWRKDYTVRRQVLPPLHYVAEMAIHREEREYYFDFMGEHDTSPHPLITRRYPMVAIIKAANTCPQICVYCQRNWEIITALDPDGIPSKEQIDKAIDWFAEHPAIRDVLITGGDPLILGDAMIEHMLSRLSEIDHVEHIRIGTRIFVTVPFRITDKLAEILGSYVEPGKRFISLVTHVESAYEVTPEMAEAVYRVRHKGIMVYNQQVFTFWNSRRFETVALRIALKKAGIDPYYTFYPKGKWETKDYLIPIARILQERKEEARLLPGMFRTEEPVFNVPKLGKNHLRAWQDRELVMIRPDGRRIYLWHPWEKNIQLVDPYLYTDIISIKMYLDRLKEVFGENPEEYKSIWYYY